MNIRNKKCNQNLMQNTNVISKKQYNFFLKKKKQNSIKENILRKSIISSKYNSQMKIVPKLPSFKNRNKSLFSNEHKSTAITKLPSVEMKKDYYFKLNSFEKNKIISLKPSNRYSYNNHNKLIGRPSVLKSKNVVKNKSLSHQINRASDFFNKNQFLWQSQINQRKKIQNRKKKENEKKKNSVHSELHLQKLNFNLMFSELSHVPEKNNFKIESRQFLKNQFTEIISIHYKFKNLKEIGKGSYATAYKATCKLSNQDFVLKTFEISNFTKKSHLNRLMVALPDYSKNLG